MNHYTESCIAMHTGIWAVDPQWLSCQLQLMRDGALAIDMKAAAVMPSSAESTTTILDSGIAVIPIAGAMVKGNSKFGGVCSTVQCRVDLRDAMESPNVIGIMLHVDSPGGTVSGMTSLQDQITAVRKVKPIHTFVPDLAASAGFWAASQSAHITAMRNALIGSIGVFTVLEDTSKKAEAEGIEFTLVKYGAHKGGATDGVPITQDDIDASQTVIDTFGAAFVDAVAKGRGMTTAQVAKLATGDVFSASTAIQNGLIDKIGNFEQALKILEGAANSGRTAKLKGRISRSRR